MTVQSENKTTLQSKGIQPAGRVFVFETESNEVTHVSENWDEDLGVANILGKHLYTICEPKLYHALKNAASAPSIIQRRNNLGAHEVAGICYDFHAMERHGQMIVDAIPRGEDYLPTAFEILRDIRLFDATLRRPHAESEIWADIANLLRSMSGYDFLQIEDLTSERKDPLAQTGFKPDIMPQIAHGTEDLWIQDARAPEVPIVSARPGLSAEIDLSPLKFPERELLRGLNATGHLSLSLKTISVGKSCAVRFLFLHELERAETLRFQLVFAHLRPLLVGFLETRKGAARPV